MAIPTAVQFFCFAATLLAGRVVRSVPMLYVVGGIATFVIGGLTGLMVAMAPFNLQAHDSFFVVAHLHTVLIGGAVFPLLAGLYYYYPLLDGRLLSERLGRASFWLVFTGFNLTFMPMHVLGLLGMPRRVFTYQSGLGWDTLNLVATVGAARAGGRLRGGAWDVVRPKRRQRGGAAQPLGRRYARMAAAAARPVVGHADDSRDRRALSALGPAAPGARLRRGPLLPRPTPRKGRREMLVTSTVDAEPQQCMRIAGPTFITLGRRRLLLPACSSSPPSSSTPWPAASTAGVAGRHPHLAVDGHRRDPREAVKHVGLGLHLPLYLRGRDGVGWWAMCITMLAVFTAFVSVLFGYFFYWTLDERFLLEARRGPGDGAGRSPPDAGRGVVGTDRGRPCARTPRTAPARSTCAIGLAAAAAVVGMVALLHGGRRAATLDPTASAYAATVWLLVIWCAVHVALGVVMQVYCAARRLAGRMTATPRHRHRQRDALLALHRSDRRAGDGRHRRISRAGVDP